MHGGTRVYATLLPRAFQFVLQSGACPPSPLEPFWGVYTLQIWTNRAIKNSRIWFQVWDGLIGWRFLIDGEVHRGCFGLNLCYSQKPAPPHPWSLFWGAYTLYIWTD